MLEYIISSRCMTAILFLLLVSVSLLGQVPGVYKKTDTAQVSAWLREGEAYLDRPESKEEDMKMAFQVADRMEQRSKQLNYQRGLGLSYLLRAKAYRESGQAAKGRPVSREALSILNTYGTLPEKAQAVIELGGSYSNDGPDYAPKVALYQEGIRRYLEMHDTLSAAKLMEFVGDLQQYGEDYNNALTTLQEALTLYQKTNFKRLQGIYSLIGQAYHGAGNFVESLRYNLKAVEVSEALGEDGQLLSTIYNRVGLMYYSITYTDQALEYFNKGLEHAKKYNDTATVRTMLINIADALRNKKEYHRSLDTLASTEKLGPIPGESEIVLVEMTYLKNFVALNELNKAQIHFQNLLTFLEKGSDQERNKQLSRLAVIFYLQHIGRFAETIPFLEDYQQTLKTFPLSLIRKADAEYMAFRTDSALGKMTAAVNHFQNYKYLSDSLTNMNQAKQLGLLRLQFETEKKDQDIELLTQKSKVQEISLQKGKVFRNVIIGGICMLSLILVLVYNRYRLKTRTAQKLAQQQQEINAQNNILQKLVEDKEWLLKEIHHRVKNNLQIIISLLNSQSQYLENEDAIAAIRNSQNRMYAMSLIHQRLYSTDNLGAIDMNWYINELVGFMQDSFDTSRNLIFDIDSDALMLDVAQAIPLGLILNEAVSNSIKYAFPEDRKGTVTIIFNKDSYGYCALSIADNGVGFGRAKPEESTSLGMSLMKGLAEQLNGTFHLKSNEDGVLIQVRFLIGSFINAN
ncbi:MAG: tetratricopeptide repeat protein [Chitinophaga sp.]|uniref:histidine kinase dimerization/phosphoacceptor domain -containing protein n=1 Tax=Chitinophaga sp. TaxID=1869181 RepID=UPI001B0EE31E|nr:histidine kinase dimerization/phosphoacceptor domain -containing protein [Chitinophaga sp.]MBO9729837.1 tetratricopeptide repeat protein [Chitinophaga sp.]